MMNHDPTIEGLVRYPTTSGFFDIASFFVVRKGASRLVPCQCRASCFRPCEGVCGCQACAWRSAAEGLPMKAEWSKH
jgi:hypothetical protein